MCVLINLFLRQGVNSMLTGEAVEAIVGLEDRDLERWLGRLLLLSQTETGRASIAALLDEFGSLIDEMVVDARKSLGAGLGTQSGFSPGQGRTTDGLRGRVRRDEIDTGRAQSIVAAEFVSYVTNAATGLDDDSRKLVVALVLWPELRAGILTAP